MKSKLAEEMRREDIEHLLSMEPSERAALALRMGQQALARYATAHGLTRDEALREMRRQRRNGRHYSRCIEELDESASR